MRKSKKLIIAFSMINFFGANILHTADRKFAVAEEERFTSDQKIAAAKEYTYRLARVMKGTGNRYPFDMRLYTATSSVGRKELRLVAMYGDNQKDFDIRTWRLKTGKEIKRLRQHWPGYYRNWLEEFCENHQWPGLPQELQEHIESSEKNDEWLVRLSESTLMGSAFESGIPKEHADDVLDLVRRVAPDRESSWIITISRDNFIRRWELRSDVASCVVLPTRVRVEKTVAPQEGGSELPRFIRMPDSKAYSKALSSHEVISRMWFMATLYPDDFSDQTLRILRAIINKVILPQQSQQPSGLGMARNGLSILMRRYQSLGSHSCGHDL